MADPVTIYQSDHDLLLRLDERTIAMVQAIIELTSSINKKTDDHEIRLRSLELKVTDAIATRDASDRVTKVAGAILIFLVGIGEFIVQHFWK